MAWCQWVGGDGQWFDNPNNWRDKRVPRPGDCFTIKEKGETMQKQYEVGDHELMDGTKVRILCNDRAGSYPIVGIVDPDDGDGGYMETYTEDGRTTDCCETAKHMARDDDDLKPPATTLYVNVYRDPWSLMPHISRKAARGAQSSRCVACVKVSFTEGEGLETPPE